jgi:iron(III) transport system ATP-binding protein
MGIANFIPVRKSGEDYLVGGGAQPIPWEKPEGGAPQWAAGFRPSDVRLAREKESLEKEGLNEKGLNGKGLRGVVRRASFLGAMMDYLIEIDGASLRTSVETHEALAENLMFQEGESCVVNFRNLLWFDAGSLTEVLKS